MKRIFVSLLYLSLLYLLLALLTEVLIANYASAAATVDWVHISCSAIHHAVERLVQFKWK